MTTDRSNLLLGGIFRMRMCYSIPGVAAGTGLRSCTQNLPAVPGIKPSSSNRHASATARGLFPRVCRCGAAGPGRGRRARRLGLPAATAGDPQWGRNAMPGRHSSGTAARLSGGRARTGATENLGSRRRLGGGTSVSEGSDAVGSVKGVHALGGNQSGDHFENSLMSVAPERTIVSRAGGHGSVFAMPGPLPR